MEMSPIPSDIWVDLQSVGFDVGSSHWTQALSLRPRHSQFVKFASCLDFTDFRDSCSYHHACHGSLL